MFIGNHFFYGGGNIAEVTEAGSKGLKQSMWYPLTPSVTGNVVVKVTAGVVVGRGPTTPTVMPNVKANVMLIPSVKLAVTASVIDRSERSGA